MIIALLATLVACNQAERYEGAFNQPHARAVLHETAGPFDETIGYVADQYDGQVSLLALKQGRFLADGGHASFARGAPIALGRARVINDLATYSPDGTTVSVFAADAAFGQVLKAPHVVGLDAEGTPIRAELTWEGPTGSSTASLTELTFHDGYTSTEDWTVTYDANEDRWWTEGTRSGRLESSAEAGVPFVGPRGVIAFTIDGQGSDGDSFAISTDSGLEEFDVGGVPTGLAMSPDQTRLAVIVRDLTLDQTRLAWMDPNSGALTDIALPLNAEPARMEYAGDTLFVADTNRPFAYAIGPDGDLSEYALPEAAFDVAALLDDDGSGWLFAASNDGRTIWMLELPTGRLVDINDAAPGVQGQSFDEPVQGITAIPMSHQWVERDANGERLVGRTVAISLQSARLVFMEEASGCLTRDLFGPTTDPTTTQQGTIDYTTGISGFQLDGRYPFLVQNETNTRHVVVHPCGGIARNETWLLTYRRNLQGWQVEAQVSGMQQGIAYEDQRYTSDDGSVSFTIRSGGLPSEEGWTIQFRSNDGIVSADGDSADPGTRIAMTLPGDPLYFHYTAGVEGQQTDRPYILVLAEGADTAVRVHPGTGAAEVEWW